MKAEGKNAILWIYYHLNFHFRIRGRSPHKRFEGLPKQKKTSWSESDKEKNTGKESPYSSSATSSVSSHDYTKRKQSVRPPPGSPKKRENSPKKKIIPMVKFILIPKIQLYFFSESLSIYVIFLPFEVSLLVGEGPIWKVRMPFCEIFEFGQSWLRICDEIDSRTTKLEQHHSIRTFKVTIPNFKLISLFKIRFDIQI